MVFAFKLIVDEIVRPRGADRDHRHDAWTSAMILLILGLVFIVLVALGMPISFAVGVASVVATLLLPGVDNATIVQRMLTVDQHLPAARRHLLRLRRAC